MIGPPPPLMGMQTSGPSGNSGPNSRFNPRQPGPTNLPNTSGPPPSMTGPSMGGPKRQTGPPKNLNSGPASQRANSLKEQQAKQRAELIAHTQSFLNPAITKKEESPGNGNSTTGSASESAPAPPPPPPAEVSTSTAGSSKTTSSTSTSSDTKTVDTPTTST